MNGIELWMLESRRQAARMRERARGMRRRAGEQAVGAAEVVERAEDRLAALLVRRVLGLVGDP